MWPLRLCFTSQIILLSFFFFLIISACNVDQKKNSQNRTTIKESLPAVPDAQSTDILNDPSLESSANETKIPTPSLIETKNNSLHKTTAHGLNNKAEKLTIYLYDSKIDSTGAIDFTSFQEACKAHRPPGTGVANPFISDTHNDIKSLVGNYGTAPVKSYPKNLQISPSWNELWDGNIDISLKIAEILTGKNAADKEWWSGSDMGGIKNTTRNCNNWKSSLNYQLAPVGDSKSINGSWINASFRGCSAKRSLLCISW